MFLLHNSGWGTFCTKEHFTPRNILLLKSWTHLAAQNTWKSHNLLLSTPCSLTPFYTQNPLLIITPCSITPFATQNLLLLITPCSSTLFVSQHPLLPGALYYSTHFALWTETEIIPFIHLDKHFMSKVHQELFFTTSNEVIWTKIFQEAKCSRVQRGLRSKVGWGAKCI